ncbi:MAG: hypothetical protein M8866_10575 [marine benthic group bacterium]|nr:hypothetical protein [Candidatus Benthicola marisminoris]
MNARAFLARSLTLVGFAFLVTWIGCSAPTGPDRTAPEAAEALYKKGGTDPGDAPADLPPPDPQYVQPSSGEQSQTIDVVITGTDFGEPGEACDVNWLLDGVSSSSIATDASQCVSPTQIDATISIASDAAADLLYDVEVVIGKGKGRRRGIGSEKFTVKQNQSLVEFSSAFTILTADSSEPNDGVPDLTAGAQPLKGGVLNDQIRANGDYLLNIDFAHELAALIADPALAEQVCIPPDRRDLKGDLRLFQALGLDDAAQWLGGELEVLIEKPSKNGRSPGNTVVNLTTGDFFITTGRGDGAKVYEDGDPTRAALNGGYVRINYSGPDASLPPTNLCTGIVDYEVAVYD